MRASPDQFQAMTLAYALVCAGARLGAAQVLFNAALQRQSAEKTDATKWTIWGHLPDRRQPAEHLDPANDHLTASEQPSRPVA